MDSQENEINYDYSSMSLIDSITLDKDIVRDIVLVFHHTIQADTSSDIATHQLTSEVYFPVTISSSAVEEIISSNVYLSVFIDIRKWKINLKRLFLILIRYMTTGSVRLYYLSPVVLKT